MESESLRLTPTARRRWQRQRRREQIGLSSAGAKTRLAVVVVDYCSEETRGTEAKNVLAIDKEKKNNNRERPLREASLFASCRLERERETMIFFSFLVIIVKGRKKKKKKRKKNVKEKNKVAIFFHLYSPHRASFFFLPFS